MNSFIFRFFYSLKTFAWKILHGRMKARPSGQNAPITVGTARDLLSPITYVVFASGHAGPRIFQGPAKNPRPALHCGAGRGIFFFLPRPVPRFCGFQGPIFASPHKFPVLGPRFLWGTVRGPANCSQFRAGDAYFWCMLSNKHTPDRQGWRIFTIWHLLSTGNADHQRILGSKNTPDPQS